MIALQRDATVLAVAAAPGRWYATLAIVTTILVAILALLVHRDRRGGFAHPTPDIQDRGTLPALGPSRLSLLTRFVIGICVSGGLALLMLATATSGPAERGLQRWVWKIGGSEAFIACFIGSLFCATAVTMSARKTMPRALLFGLCGGLIAGLADFAMLWLLRPVGILAGGALIGIAIGIADDTSRDAVMPSLDHEP